MLQKTEHFGMQKGLGQHLSAAIMMKDFVFRPAKVDSRDTGKGGTYLLSVLK